MTQKTESPDIPGGPTPNNHLARLPSCPPGQIPICGKSSFQFTQQESTIRRTGKRLVKPFDSFQARFQGRFVPANDRVAPSDREGRWFLLQDQSIFLLERREAADAYVPVAEDDRFASQVDSFSSTAWMR